MPKLDAEGNVIPDNTETQTQTQSVPDVAKLVTELNAANAALAEKDKQYKGLQTTYNALHESNKVLLSEKETLLADQATIKNQMDQLGNDQGNFKAQFDELTGKYQSLEGEKGKLELKLSRSDLILGDFADLLEFEQKGLLPEFDGDEEAFKAKLTTFKETLGAQSKQAIDDELEGGGPDNTDSTNTKPDREKIITEMIKIAGVQDKADRYEDLRDQLDAIDAKDGKPVL